MVTTKPTKKRPIPVPIDEFEKKKYLHTVITPTTFCMAEGGIHRQIIIDGCNFMYVAFNKAKDVNVETDKFNPLALLILTYDLLRYGFEVKIFIKEYFKNDYDDMDKTTVNIDIINTLESLGFLEVLPDQGVDDDERILAEADRRGACVLSADQFRQRAYQQFESRRRRVELRVGSTAPPPRRDSAHARLHGCVRFRFSEAFRWLSYAIPGEPDYEKVRQVSLARDRDALSRRLEQLEVLADFYHCEQLFYERHCAQAAPDLSYMPYLRGVAQLPHRFHQFWELYCRSKDQKSGVKRVRGGFRV